MCLSLEQKRSSLNYENMFDITSSKENFAFSSFLEKSSFTRRLIFFSHQMMFNARAPTWELTRAMWRWYMRTSKKKMLFTSSKRQMLSGRVVRREYVSSSFFEKFDKDRVVSNRKLKWRWTNEVWRFREVSMRNFLVQNYRFYRKSTRISKFGWKFTAEIDTNADHIENLWNYFWSCEWGGKEGLLWNCWKYDWFKYDGVRHHRRNSSSFLTIQIIQFTS